MYKYSELRPTLFTIREIPQQTVAGQHHVFVETW
jgi:hypothetical protein